MTEGDYKFILNARSGDGDVSERPLTITIIIKKPISMKWWFYVVTILLLFTFILVYIKRQEHKLPMLRQRELLESKLKAWMKDEVQTDDITVTGIRL